MLSAQTWQTVDDFQALAGTSAWINGMGKDPFGNIYAVGLSLLARAKEHRWRQHVVHRASFQSRPGSPGHWNLFASHTRFVHLRLCRCHRDRVAETSYHTTVQLYSTQSRSGSDLDIHLQLYLGVPHIIGCRRLGKSLRGWKRGRPLDRSQERRWRKYMERNG